MARVEPKPNLKTKKESHQKTRRVSQWHNDGPERSLEQRQVPISAP
jgi:hypothetical protein